ncbi:hypothetical protein LINPERHAP1_LOCUS37696, partial [Linum perenne]
MDFLQKIFGTNSSMDNYEELRHLARSLNNVVMLHARSRGLENVRSRSNHVVARDSSNNVIEWSEG